MFHERGHSFVYTKFANYVWPKRGLLKNILDKITEQNLKIVKLMIEKI
jgi:hypothetical protein